MTSLVLFAVLYLTHAAAVAGGSTQARDLSRELDRAFLGAIRAGRREEVLTLVDHLETEITLQAGNYPASSSAAVRLENRFRAAYYLRALYQDAADRGEEYRVTDGRVETFWKSGPWAEVA